MTSNAFCRRAVAGLARECDDILGGGGGLIFGIAGVSKVSWL